MSNALATDQQTERPSSVSELVTLVRSAASTHQAVYPIGGDTCPRYGLSATRPGCRVELGELNRVIDYPSADMTITVEAGITMQALANTLSQQGQRLPLDVPQAEQATLGGVLATNFSGPLRFGFGTARDYVIGIRAVDGRGESFSGGGRVVKNVAGYDFCKLLVGSMGTLGIITEVTLKLKPLAFGSRVLVAAPESREECERMLAELTHGVAQPVAIEWLAGPAWHEMAKSQQWPRSDERLSNAGWIVVILEGLDVERDWMTDQLQHQWRTCFSRSSQWNVLDEPSSKQVRERLVEFPAQECAAMIKVQTVPSAVLRMASLMESSDLSLSFQAHAGNGTLIASIPKLPASGLSQPVLREWQPAALATGGSIVFLTAPLASDHTPRMQWGEPSGPLALMQRIKNEFDPHGILNPQRFIFS